MISPKDKPIHIILAIPTYDRIEKLKILLNSIESQVGDASFACSLVISNSESTDGTFEFIDSLKPFGIVREVIKYNKSKNKDGQRPNNWNNLFRTIPFEDGWVWLLGDDDYLVSPTCLRNLAHLIGSHDCRKVNLIHLAQARRSKGSRQIKQLNLVDAANTFGLLEILGWMSSIVIRSNLISQRFLQPFEERKDEPLAPNETNQNSVLEARQSAFKHSAQILKTCADSEILVVDDYFAEPQDEVQTAASIKRWAEEDMVIRYMFVIDDVEFLHRKGIVKERVSATFFRYHTHFLWDRFTHHVVQHVSHFGELNDYCLAFIDRLNRVEKLLGKPPEIQLYRVWRMLFLNAIEDSIKSRLRYLESNDRLDRLVRLGYSGVYSFDTFL